MALEVFFPELMYSITDANADFEKTANIHFFNLKFYLKK